MKKFISLFVIAAVLAFAGMAFANDGDVSALATADDPATNSQNNGAITPITGGTTPFATNLYYMGTVPTNFELGMNATVAGDSSSSPAASLPLKGLWSSTWSASAVDSSKTTAAGGGEVKDLVFSITGADLATNKIWYVGVDNKASTADGWLGAVAGVEVVPTVVSAEIAPISGTTADKQITGTLVWKSLADAEMVPGNATFTVDGSDVIGAGVTLSPDKKIVIVKPTATDFKQGSNKFNLTFDKLEVSFDNTKAVTPAGFTASSTVVAEVEVMIALAPNKSMDKTAYSYRQGTSTDLVISTDIASGDIKYVAIDDVEITKSADILTSADNAGSTTTSPDTKLTIAYAYLDTLKSGDHTIYVGDGAPTAAATTKLASAKLTVIAPEKPDPVYPVDQLSTTQAAAVAALVAGSADLGLATVASHDAFDRYVDTQLTSALISKDIRGYFEIAQPVTSGDYVAIDGARIPVAPKSGETVTFFKNFGTITEPDRVSLREAMSGDVLEAAVLIVDNELPANVQGAWKSSKDSKKGVVFRKVNGTNVVVIYDGNKNGSVVDPIEAHVNRGSSSSSCDLGFGLVAVAGLAVLALRKRSK